MIYHRARTILILIFLSAEMSLADSTNSSRYSKENINLDETNSGSNIEIVVGANLNIFLNVPSQDLYKSICYWSKINVSDASVLKEVQREVLLPTGVTAAFFQAIRPGLAQIDSFRNNCSDGGVIRWHVEIRATYYPY
jgi:hypothetical protein